MVHVSQNHQGAETRRQQKLELEKRITEDKDTSWQREKKETCEKLSSIKGEVLKPAS